MIDKIIFVHYVFSIEIKEFVNACFPRIRHLASLGRMSVWNEIKRREAAIRSWTDSNAFLRSDVEVVLSLLKVAILPLRLE